MALQSFVVLHSQHFICYTSIVYGNSFITLQILHRFQTQFESVIIIPFNFQLNLDCYNSEVFQVMWSFQTFRPFYSVSMTESHQCICSGASKIMKSWCKIYAINSKCSTKFQIIWVDGQCCRMQSLVIQYIGIYTLAITVDVMVFDIDILCSSLHVM